MEALSIAMLVIFCVPSFLIWCFGVWAAAQAGRPYPGTTPHRYGPKYPRW